MYLLTFDDQFHTDPKKYVKSEKHQLNMCVSRCEDFAHNYVSNPDVMKCEFCGPDC